MPDSPEPLAQHPRLAALLKDAFGGRFPAGREFQRFVELVDRDYADAGAPGAPDVGAADCCGGGLWKFRKSGNAFRHAWCRGQLLRRLGLVGVEMEGKTLEEIFPSEIVARLAPNYHRAWSGACFSVTLELSELGADLHAQFQPVFVDGAVLEVVVTAVEESEPGHERYFEPALNRTSEAVVVTSAGGADGVGEVVFINQSFLNITALDRTAVLGRTLFDLHGPRTDPTTIQRMLEAMANGRSFAGQLHFIRKDGTDILLECHVSPLLDPDGRVTHWICVERDISEQGRFATAMRATEERYHSVIESLREVVFQVDVSGRWSFLNPAWREISGFTVRESLGTPLFNYVHPEDRLRNDALFRPVGKHSPGFARYEFRCVTKGGGFRWVEVFARLDCGLSGEVTGISGTLSDITDRKESERRLTESEERFRVMFVTSPIGMILTELDGTIVDANQAFLNIVGYRAVEMANMSLWQLTPPQYFASEQMHMSRIHETGRYGPHEKEFFNRAGRCVPVVLNGMLVRGSEGRRQIWSFVEDITERKSAQLALAESERRFRDVSNAVGEFIWEADGRGRINFVTGRVAEALGANSDEFVGRDVADLVRGADRPQWEAIVRSALARRKGFTAVEIRHESEAKGSRWLSLTGLPVYDAAGQLECFRGAGRDITYRKESDAARLAAEERFNLLIESSADAF
ncbi:MAG TPA: PAS domain S-box protein [Opitutaceae bacterium]